MANVLLTSERFVKDATSISDNLAGKFLLPAIREAQEDRLRDVLGTCLLEKLKGLVATDPESHTRPIDDAANVNYKELLDRAQYFLAYAAASNACEKTAFKVANAGVVRSTDDHYQPAQTTDVSRERDYYTFKADSCLGVLQRWLLDNRAKFPELDACQCNQIRAHLRSAASSGLWLGGPRGKILPGGGGSCR